MKITEYVASLDRNALMGVSLMLVTAAAGAIDSAIARQLSPHIHPFVMGFTRSFFGMLAILFLVIRRPGILHSHYRFRHVLRAALKLCAVVSYFFAYARAPLADATAIAFTAPIFLTIGAWIFLSEKPQKLRIIAVLVGFSGVMLVIRPGQGEGLSIGLMFALLGAFLTALIQLILKPMAAKDSTDTLVSWNLIVTVPIAAIPAALFWTMPSGGEILLLVIQGLLGALAMACATRAFSLADASLISPIDFMRLPFAAILGYVFFAQTVPTTTWIGGAVIASAAVLLAQSAKKRRESVID